MYTANDETAFITFFSGNDGAYGVTEVTGKIDENGKAESRSHLEYGKLTPSIVKRHLEGSISIGVAPLRNDGTCLFGAIDIDDYEGDLSNVIHAIYRYSLPICPFYSKSHHLHLYLFTATPTPAEDLVKLLRWYAMALDCPKKVEIFPKQTRVTAENKFYSWINLPYYNEKDMDNCRKMVANDLSLLSLGEAIPHIRDACKTYGEHEAFIEHLPFNDAPPCVLCGILLNDIGPGCRNNWLFSVGVYLKLKEPDCDLEEALTSINKSLKNPLEESELQHTIIEGFQKKSYFYMCNNALHCNEARCLSQKLGKGTSQASGIDYGELTQYMSALPYYEWIVNGQIMTFYSEAEIIGQTQFRNLCARQLHKLPNRIKDTQWTEIVNKALSHMKVVESFDTQDFGTGASLAELLMNFCYTRPSTSSADMAIGKVYFEKTTQRIYFRAQDLLQFVRDNHFTALSGAEIRAELYRVGMRHDEELKAWWIPVSVVPEPPKKEEIKNVDAF